MGPKPVPDGPGAVQIWTEEDRHDPFGAGAHPAGVRTVEVADRARQRRLPCELWYPAATGAGGENRNARAAPGATPLVVFSHSSGGDRRQSTFLCTHLASHGYAVAAADHSEAVVPELARRPDGTEADERARQAAWIASRVPDVRALLDHLLAGGTDLDVALDPQRIAVAGHSFGGWTALATPDVDPRIRAVVALHLDAVLRESAGARAFWAGDVDAALAGRGLDAFEVRS